MKKIILIGGGGHCKVVIEALRLGKKYLIAGIIDAEKCIGATIAGVPVIGDDSALPGLRRKGIKYCFVALGSVGDPGKRKKLFTLAKQKGFILPNIAHPKAIVSKNIEIGEGNFVGAGAIINPGSVIGSNCIINTGSIVEHDCRIGDTVHIATGTFLSGGVKIGSCSHVGAGSVILQLVEVGGNTVIGAGSVVTKNVSSGVVAYGAPCKFVRKNHA